MPVFSQGHASFEFCSALFRAVLSLPASMMISAQIASSSFRVFVSVGSSPASIGGTAVPHETINQTRPYDKVGP
jgi:hypothetical protein